jgi:hypothetical protein
MDIHRLLDESGFQKVVSSFRSLINVQDSPLINVGIPGLAGLVAFFSNIPTEYGVLAGICLNATSGIALRKRKKIDGLPAGVKDFGYLYSIEKKFGRKLASRQKQ